MIDLEKFKNEEDRKLYVAMMEEYWKCFDDRVRTFFDTDSKKNLKYKLAYLKAVNSGKDPQMIKGWEKALEKYPGVGRNPGGNWDL